MKIYEGMFQESEEYQEPFRMFFASEKECRKWIKENYEHDNDENKYFITKLNIPTNKKDLIRFLNNHFDEGGG